MKEQIIKRTIQYTEPLTKPQKASHTFKQQNFRFGRDKRIGILYVLRGCRKDSSKKLSGSKGKIFSAKSESHKELGF